MKKTRPMRYRQPFLLPADDAIVHSLRGKRRPAERKSFFGNFPKIPENSRNLPLFFISLFREIPHVIIDTST